MKWREMSLDQYFDAEKTAKAKVQQSLAERIEKLTGFKLSEFQRRAIKLLEETDDNIVVAAPTGAGKTVIGYAALLKHGGGFYLAPLIAIMTEKYHELSSIFKKLGYSIIVTNRDYRIPYTIVLESDIRIMSPYKFLTYSHLLDPDRHGKVVVVDEFHKLSGDPMFEAAVTMARNKGFRIVALSATISDEDLERVAKWLNAKVVKETVRPVKLEHYPLTFHYMGNIVAARTVSVNKKPIVEANEVFRSREEAAAIIAARLHTITEKPVLVWAPTRRMVEQIARMIADVLPEKDEYVKLAEKIVSSNPSEALLRYTVRHGVFIHHGGLSFSVRELVENEYKKNGGVLVTAYTLSHGVNLPGTFLVLSTLRDYKGDVLDASTFHQISGRAGRPGLDTIGIVLAIVVGEAEYAVYEKLVEQKASKIEPHMLRDPYSLSKLLLPVYATTRSWEKVSAVARASYSYLVENNSEELLSNAIEVMKRVVEYYSKISEKEAYYAMLMGIFPLEFEAVKSVLASSSYKEAVEKVLDYACQIHGVEPGEVYDDILHYGYLASWFGNPAARQVADTIQTILETGAFWAARVYGWKSQEREKLVSIAKKFAYAGNERVEPLAQAVRIDVLRRMIKAVPQLVEGVTKSEDAYTLTVVAIKEAFLFRKRVYRKSVAKLINLVFYALVGREPIESEHTAIYNEVVRELKNKKIEVV